MFTLYADLNTTRNSRDPSAYRISIVENYDESEAQPLRQNNPTFNNVANYAGHYETRAAAEDAARRFVAPRTLRRLPSDALRGRESYVVLR